MRPSLITPLLIIALATSASAQTLDPFTARGIDLVPIKFTPTMESGLALEGGELQLTRSYLLTAMLDFNFGILAAKNGTERLGELMPFRTDLHIMGAYQLHPRIEVSADLPITVLQIHNFALLNGLGFTTTPPNAAGIGAPRILGRVQILKQSELPIVGLAGVLEVRIPIGDTNSFLSDRGFVFAPRLAVERTIGPVRLMGNIGWRLRTAPGRFINLYVGQEFTLGGGAVIDLPPFSRFNENQIIAEIQMATPAEAPFTFTEAEALKTPLELLVGARTRFAGNFCATLAIGKGLGQSGYGREAFRITLALTYEKVAEPDDDDDGIPNKIDACPDKAEDKDGIEDGDGCPEDRDPDRDNDGVPDKIDACPDTAGLQELDGCPDRDGDQNPRQRRQVPGPGRPARSPGLPAARGRGRRRPRVRAHPHQQPDPLRVRQRSNRSALVQAPRRGRRGLEEEPRRRAGADRRSHRQRRLARSEPEPLEAPREGGREVPRRSRHRAEAAQERRLRLRQAGRHQRHAARSREEPSH
ncbi:MAG: hypothetical protein QM817_02735 [Archangium sp.]